MKNFLKALLGVMVKARFLQSAPAMEHAPGDRPSRIKIQYADTVPAEAPRQQRHFVHMVGDFNRARVELAGKKVELADLKHKPAHGGISEYFTLETANTTYVLWNNPDDVQRAIQKDRVNHFDVAADQVVRIGRDDTVLVEERALPVLTDAVDVLSDSTRGLSDAVHDAARHLRQTVSDRRQSIPRPAPGLAPA